LLGHAALVQAYLATGQAARALRHAEVAKRQLELAVRRKRLTPADKPLASELEWLYARALHDVGRLEEAVEAGERALARGTGTVEEAHGETLAAWRRDVSELALGYAREGWHRGEPGRVLAGLGRTPVETPEDAVMMLHSLIRLGREESALYALGHFEGRGLMASPAARIAAARTLLLEGDLSGALNALVGVYFADPMGQSALERLRLLRLAATYKASEWRAVIDGWHAAGAVTAARVLARDAADFVPGFEPPEAFASSAATPSPFEPGSLAGLRALMDAEAAERVHRGLSDGGRRDSLAEADRMAAGWTEWLPPEGDPARLGAVTYVAVAAVGHYLSSATSRPSVRQGALRQIAMAAFALVAGHRGELPTAWHGATLRAFEAFPSRPRPLFDRWLLRAQEALDIVNRLGARASAHLQADSAVHEVLRGDERLDAELAYATTALDRGISRDHVDALLERCARARGATPLALRATLHQDDEVTDTAVDVHWCAVLASPYDLTGHLALACAFFSQGRAEDGFTAACRAVLHAGPTRRARCLAALREVWPETAAVPFDVAKAAELLASETAPSTRAQCLEWLHAHDPQDVAVSGPLAQLRVQGGDPRGAIRVLARSEPFEAPRQVANLLTDDGQARRAAAAWRYACVSHQGLGDLLELGAVAWSVGDDVAAVEAFEMAYRVTDGKLFPAQLNALAMALIGVGEYTRAVRVARTLLERAVDDATWLAFGYDAMARASLGKGRLGAALRWAEQAVETNPTPDAADHFAETLQWARVPELCPLQSAGTPSLARARRLLAAGDVHGALEASGRGGSWAMWRVFTAAAAFRFKADNARPVAEEALRAADKVLGATQGYLSREAVLCRVEALQVMDTASGHGPQPALLGQRLLAPAFEAQCVARAEASRGPV